MPFFGYFNSNKVISQPNGIARCWCRQHRGTEIVNRPNAKRRSWHVGLGLVAIMSGESTAMAHAPASRADNTPISVSATIRYCEWIAATMVVGTEIQIEHKLE